MDKMKTLTNLKWIIAGILATVVWFKIILYVAFNYFSKW